MRQFTIGILCSAAFLATACNKHPENQAEADLNEGGEVENASVAYYAIEAGPVTGTRSAGIKGSFKITQASGPEDGIESQLYGGACIVFPAQQLGYTAMAKARCTSNDDCSKPDPTIDPKKEESGYYVPDASKPTEREHRYGYCDQQNHQCWARPIYMNGDFVNPKTFDAASALCKKSAKIFGTPPWIKDKDNPLSVSAANLAGFGLKPGAVKARVVACLQATNATPATGCNSVNGPDRMEVLGPESPVKP